MHSRQLLPNQINLLRSITWVWQFLVTSTSYLIMWVSFFSLWPLSDFVTSFFRRKLSLLLKRLSVLPLFFHLFFLILSPSTLVSLSSMFLSCTGIHQDSHQDNGLM